MSRPLADGHEIGDLEDAAGRTEIRHQDIGIAQVALSAHLGSLRPEAEVAALAAIEYSGEYRTRIETRKAESIYGAVRADERGGERIAHDTVISQVQVAALGHPSPFRL